MKSFYLPRGLVKAKSRDHALLVQRPLCECSTGATGSPSPSENRSERRVQKDGKSQPIREKLVEEKWDESLPIQEISLVPLFCYQEEKIEHRNIRREEGGRNVGAGLPENKAEGQSQ